MRELVEVFKEVLMEVKKEKLHYQTHDERPLPTLAQKNNESCV